MSCINFYLSGFLSPLISNNITIDPENYRIEDLTPNFNAGFFMTFAWLLYAVGGAEVIGPMVNDVKNPKKQFPKAIIIGACIIAFLYIMGTFAVSFISTQEYYAEAGGDSGIILALTYKALVTTMGLPLWFINLATLIQAIVTIVALVMWSYANVQVMFTETPADEIPAKLTKLNSEGTAINGSWFQVILIFILLLIQTIDSDINFYYLLYDMSTMAVVFPYIALVLAYIIFKFKNQISDYQISSNRNLAIVIGSIVLFLNVFGFVFAGYDVSVPFNEQLNDISVFYGGFVFLMLVGVVMRHFWRSKKHS